MIARMANPFVVAVMAAFKGKLPRPKAEPRKDAPADEKPAPKKPAS